MAFTSSLSNAVGKADRLCGRKDHLRHEQLGRLLVVTPKLVDADGNRLILVGILALDHKHRNAVDQEDHVLAVAVPAVMDGELLGHLVDVSIGLVVVDQCQVEFPAFGLAVESRLVAEIFQQFAVAEDACLDALKLAGQGAGRFRVFWVELADLGVEQFVEVQRRPLRGQGGVRAAGVEPPPPLGLGPRHVRPADLLGVCQNTRLNRLVFAGFGHGILPLMFIWTVSLRPAVSKTPSGLPDGESGWPAKVRWPPLQDPIQLVWMVNQVGRLKSDGRHSKTPSSFSGW
jgi:hypothetical protein